MSNPFGRTVLSVYLAKHMVENRGGEATEKNGSLEIRRNGEFLCAPPIFEDCVSYLAICGAFMPPFVHQDEGKRNDYTKDDG